MYWTTIWTGRRRSAKYTADKVQPNKEKEQEGTTNRKQPGHAADNVAL